MDILTLVINFFGMATIANSDTVPKATSATKAIKSTLVLKPLKKDQPISIFVICRRRDHELDGDGACWIMIIVSFGKSRTSRAAHLFAMLTIEADLISQRKYKIE